ncbi:hypothetical protein BDV39DRAFT_187998 [Aspergillus sergii]|uniref:Uncharacterized protein n=1 Tax=Aspergillus sergii TaxID=1034303 RepID=A0A5N6WIA3_9EURO|nr:hypothetical protein BDV39DRAFT_187998 [Aspergillus sergii]
MWRGPHPNALQIVPKALNHLSHTPPAPEPRRWPMVLLLSDKVPLGREAIHCWRPLAPSRILPSRDLSYWYRLSILKICQVRDSGERGFFSLSLFVFASFRYPL